MSRNIYDIFNARKEGLDYLSESYGYQNEPFADLEDGIKDLDMIVRESTMDFIEFQGAMYLEDLVLENMMYENFDEERIAPILEGKLREMGGSVVQKIKNLWERIKEWFKRIFATIKNFFTENRKLVANYKGQIPERMKNCDKEIKMHDWQHPNNAMADAVELAQIIYDKGTDAYSDKDELLKAIGVKDVKEMVELAKEAFMGKVKAETRKVSSLNPEIAMSYLYDEKIFLDHMQKQKIDMDNKFKEVLQVLQAEAKDADKDNKKDANKVASVFQFAVNMKTKVLNTAIACIKRGASENRSAILKALGKGGDAKQEEPTNESYLFYDEDLYKF